MAGPKKLLAKAKPNNPVAQSTRSSANHRFMKKHALSVFRKKPEQLNCAQSVLYGWREVSGDTSIPLDDVKLFGGGRAPGGLCGALHTACMVAPDQAKALKQNFALRLGSLYCKELHADKVHPCQTCVDQATELLEHHFVQVRAGS